MATKTVPTKTASPEAPPPKAQPAKAAPPKGAASKSSPPAPPVAKSAPSAAAKSPVKTSAPPPASPPQNADLSSKAPNRQVTSTKTKPQTVPEKGIAPEEAVAAAAPAEAPVRPMIIVAAPPTMPIRNGGNPNSPRPPMGRPNMPPSFAVRGPGRPGFAEAQAAAPRPPAAKIELKAGDHVVYPTHGVGTVQGIETVEAAGIELQMIVVTFDENRMTLRVPVNKVPTAGLRKLFTPKEFEVAIDTLKGRARIKRTMWSRRAQEYEAKINSGDPIQIAEVVRDLQRNAGQPDQSFSERQIYEQALERLAAEYAAIEKIDKLTASEQLVAFAKST